MLKRNNVASHVSIENGNSIGLPYITNVYKRLTVESVVEEKHPFTVCWQEIEFVKYGLVWFIVIESHA